MPASKWEMFDPAAILTDTQHRDWPIPRSPWVMQQVWYGLLFAHWTCPAERVRALIPDELELDTFGGEAWISLTPFRLNVRLRGLTAFGDVLSFPELNCRTYVRYKGHEGIYFFSLDAASRLAVMGAQSLYRLPYYFAAMEHHERDGRIWFRSERRARSAQFEANYQPIGEARKAQKGTLEHWLVERYRLYTVAAGKVLHADIHHKPWLLSQADYVLGRDTVSSAAGFSLSEPPALVQYSASLDVLIWPLGRS